MNAIVIDTSSWIPYFAGSGEKNIDTALREGRVYLSPIVAAELMSGKLRPAEAQKLIQLMQELPLCNSQLDHWVRVGRLRSLLIGKGLNVSTPDAHVSQCALDLDCFLLTRDLIFSKIAEIVELRLYEPLAAEKESL